MIGFHLLLMCVFCLLCFAILNVYSFFLKDLTFILLYSCHQLVGNWIFEIYDMSRSTMKRVITDRDVDMVINDFITL